MMIRIVAVLLVGVSLLFRGPAVRAEVSPELINRLTQRLQQFYDAKSYGPKLQLMSKRGQLNLLSSKLFGLLRRGHAEEVGKTLERFDVQGLDIPSLPTPEMATQKLIMLRVGQWLYTEQLAEKLGERQGQFLDDLHRIEPIQLSAKVELDSVSLNDSQDQITANVVRNGKSSYSRIRFVLSENEWFFDGTDSSMYFSLKPGGILKDSDAKKLSPVMMRDLMQNGKIDEAVTLLDEALEAEPENPRWIGLNSNLIGYLARANPDLAKQRSLDQYNAMLNLEDAGLDALLALAEAVQFLIIRDADSSLEEKLALIDAARAKVKLDPDRAYIPLRNLDSTRYGVLLRAGKKDQARKVMEDLLANHRQRLSGKELGPLRAFVGVTRTYTSTMRREFPELAQQAHAEAVRIVESTLDDDSASVPHFGLLYELESSTIGPMIKADPEAAKDKLTRLQQLCEKLRAKLGESQARGLSRYESYISRFRAQLDDQQ